MATMTKTRKKVKVSRSVKLLLPIGHDGGSGVIRISVTRGKRTTTNDYLTQRIGSDWGDGFAVEKIGGNEVYHVHLSNQGHACTCECLGHLRHGTECKHIGALKALRNADRI